MNRSRSSNLSDKPQARAWLDAHEQGRVLFHAARRTLIDNYRGTDHGYINLRRYVEYRFNSPGKDFVLILARQTKVLVTFHLSEGRRDFVVEKLTDVIVLLKFIEESTIFNFSTLAHLPEDDEIGLCYEDLSKLRQHKVFERDRKVVAQVKKLLGYKCKACGIDFAKKYREVGKRFIEAHHLSPVFKSKGKVVRRDIKRDFVVLCSNCHRMIHRSRDFIGDVEGFKAQHVVDAYWPNA